ncbi:MAG: cell division transport system permease protein [Patescibacteria group bacterium]|nr:cell division transport system permease protein [Patescibacteria group bacterium]
MTLLKRVLGAGLKGFYRNKTISIASIFILVITLTLIANLFLMQAIFNYSVAEIKKKVDISIYLKKDATDASIIAIKQTLQNLPNVNNVVYITKDETLAKFKEDYKNDAETLAALEELGSNPFGASFSVTAKDTSDYEAIMNSVQNEKVLGDNYSSIDKINYFDIKDSINKLNKILWSVERLGIFLVLILIVMSVMITYNTVRLAIFTFKEEIAVMKLVGASNTYIRGPFVVESGLYGLISSVIAIMLLYPITSWISAKTTDFFAGFNMYDWYISHVFQIFLILFIAGVLLSIVSSMLAVRKYLKV